VIQADPVKVSLERGDVLFIGDPLFFSFVIRILDFPQAFWAIEKADCLVLHALKPTPTAGIAVHPEPLYLKPLLTV